MAAKDSYDLDAERGMVEHQGADVTLMVMVNNQKAFVPNPIARVHVF
jgi:hypothetical protein